MTTSSKAKMKGEDLIFRLFVVEGEPHSKTAKDNLTRFCASHIDGLFKIEIVDVVKSFEIAVENNVFLTPVLIILSSHLPRITIVGDLSDTKEMIKALRLIGYE